MTAGPPTQDIPDSGRRNSAYDSKIFSSRIVAVVGTYLPGVKGGGHIRSISALATHLGQELELFVLCGDRDSGDRRAYPNIRIGKWTQVGRAQVMYLPRSRFSARKHKAILAELQPDILYLNTVLSIREFVVPAMVARRRFPSVQIVVAPRGCLDPGALALKRMRKALFVRLLRWSRLPKSMTWQASTQLEEHAILDAVGTVPTVVAPNLSMVALNKMSPSLVPRPHKIQGELRVVFLSRISPMKNLEYLLERLANVRGEIHLTIAGPVEDESYWERCEKVIAQKLSHVRIAQTGTVSHEDVPSVLASHHIFALPTRGENFGHAVVEALDAGLGVIISDRTPWRGLERLGAGWDLPLDNPNAWEEALQACCDMDVATFEAISAAARSATAVLYDLDAAKRANLALFRPAGPQPTAR